MKNINGMSVDDLLSFLDWASNKGQMKSATANALKAACNQVLGILDQSEKDDVSGIDIDKAFNRFKNKAGNGLSPDSLKSYRSRVRKAMREFLSYRKDPENWRPSFSQRDKASRVNGRKISTNTVSSNLRPNLDERLRRDDDVSLIHQYPLRSDVTVRIIGLPRDLKSIEAKRLSAFLMTLCEDYKPEV